MSLPDKYLSDYDWRMSAREMFTDLLKSYRARPPGLTQEAAAAELRVSLSLYKKIEQGVNRPQRDFAQRCDEFFGTPGVFERVYADLIAEPYSGWFGPRVVYEDKATAIWEWEQRGMPGLTQTEGYARAVVRACRPYDPPEIIESVIRGRMDRQDILKRDTPPRLWITLSEGVLRQSVGGPDVMAEQLDHLLKISESQFAVIQVLPFSAADAPGADGPAALFEFTDREPVAYLEGWETGRVVESPSEVAAIRVALTMIQGCALSPTDSRQLIREIRG